MTPGSGYNDLNVGGNLGGGLGDDVEVSARFTDRTFRLIDDVINLSGDSPLPQTRTKFMEEAIYSHAPDILMKVEGQKGIRDFAKDLSDDIDWININPDTKYKLDTKIEPDKNLTDSPQKISISDETKKIVDQIVKCTDLARSDIIRFCTINHLYTLVKDTSLEDKMIVDDEETLSEGKLTRTKRMVIAERWLDLENKLSNVINELIFQIHTEVTSNKFKQITNLEYYDRDVEVIIDHYEHDFKGSTGYSVMANSELGVEVINVLDSLVEEYTD